MRRTVRSAERPEHAILGQLLRTLREERGLSQRDVAAKLDRTQAYVWKIEQGKQPVDIPTLIDLAKLLQTSASILMEDVERQLPS